MTDIFVKYHSREVQEKAPLRPARAGDAGMDLYNATGAQIEVPLHRSVQIEAGLSVKIPEGMVGFVRPRSSTFVKKGLMIMEGVIDSGYTGPLYVIVYNSGVVIPGSDSLRLGPRIVEPWERLAQLIVVPFNTFVMQVETLPETPRGSSGFGSTGR